jgi:hypothetical protein
LLVDEEHCKQLYSLVNRLLTIATSLVSSALQDSTKKLKLLNLEKKLDKVLVRCAV